jgi:hypothetical protein
MSTNGNCKSAIRLSLSLLLASTLLLWSSAWNSPAATEWQLEQRGDSSPPFLPRSGDASPDDSGDSLNAGQCAELPRSSLSRCIGNSRQERVSGRRITRFPRLPQAPPFR